MDKIVDDWQLLSVGLEINIDCLAYLASCYRLESTLVALFDVLLSWFEFRSLHQHPRVVSVVVRTPLALETK